MILETPMNVDNAGAAIVIALLGRGLISGPARLLQSYEDSIYDHNWPKFWSYILIFCWNNYVFLQKYSPFFSIVIALKHYFYKYDLFQC